MADVVTFLSSTDNLVSDFYWRYWLMCSLLAYVFFTGLRVLCWLYWLTCSHWFYRLTYSLLATP